MATEIYLKDDNGNYILTDGGVKIIVGYLHKSPTTWVKNPAAYANQRKYDSSSVKYDSSTLTFDGDVANESYETAANPTTWHKPLKKAATWKVNSGADSLPYDETGAYDTSGNYDAQSGSQITKKNPTVWNWS